MPLRDLKYLAAYIVPLACLGGLYFGGWASPGILYFGFVLVPVIEYFLPASPHNEDEVTLDRKLNMPFFDILLYVNVPLVYFTSLYFVWLLAHRPWTTAELIFSVFNVGVLLGVSGINVAHELGHRQNNFDKWMARLLLLPVLYSHFTLEHNYGHHLNVGTPEDPATARKDQGLYSFYIRSIVEGYKNAWKIGSRMLVTKGKPQWMHEMIWAHGTQIVLLALVFYFSGWKGLLCYLGAALIGILVLESVNYIEHYGLVRKMLPSGRYELMSEIHSWNSDHELGRIVLFELVRHSDHHFQTRRKYQTLRHLARSPQLPYGYPASIMMALIPPLWFRVMNRRLELIQLLPSTP
ncbi:MAG: alkane 1-monooxygenase [Saprospiraceae bacterium]